MIKITQLKIDVRKLPVEAGTNKVNPRQEEKILKKEILKLLHLKKEDLKSFHIIKKSIDARKKEAVKYIYVVSVSTQKENVILKKNKNANIMAYAPKKYQFKPTGSKKLEHRPVVIGMGPAGLFCALELAKAGLKPIVFERGKCVNERIQDVEHFWKTGELNPESNVQFGEGGAGTFSDGKLNTAVKDPTGRITKVLETFRDYGAPEEICYLNKPHIGTDHLRGIVENMRNHIISLGGEVHFESKMTDIQIEEGKVTGVEINGSEIVPCEVVVLALGHSARDTFELIQQRNVKMQPKAFAIGVRVEHSQEMINESQYGMEHEILPTADYKLTYQASTGRGVYSFCMCPGGFVVNSSSEKGRLVVNGMSNYERNERNANSALIVTVTPDDFGSDSILAGMEFQRKWERLAYEEGNGKIPVQLFKDFRDNKISEGFGHVVPCMKGSYTFGNIRKCLPDYVSKTLIEGMEAFDRKIKGYYDEEAVFAGVETRTSSPVRIVRDENLEGNVIGIYPCGEGAGYAGGITSAAIDGIKVFEAIARKYKL